MHTPSPSHNPPQGRDEFIEFVDDRLHLGLIVGRAGGVEVREEFGRSRPLFPDRDIARVPRLRDASRP